MTRVVHYSTSTTLDDRSTAIGRLTFDYVDSPVSDGVIRDSRVCDWNHRRGGVWGHPVHGDHRRLGRQRVDQHHQSGVEHQRLVDEAGGVTVEAAFAIAALVVVLVLCVSGLTAVSMQ